MIYLDSNEYVIYFLILCFSLKSEHLHLRQVVLLDGFVSSKTNKLYVFGVSAIVEPYTELTNNGQPSSDCTSWQAGTTCGKRSDFVDGQKAQIAVRLPNTITGWLHGRFKDASIAIEKYDSNQTQVLWIWL